MDGESVLPPPFTLFYLIHKLFEVVYKKISETIITKTAAATDVESPTLKQKKELEIRCAQAKELFEKRYTHLMLTLTCSIMDKDKIS